jgi:NADPH-dependent curcumin reductase CurA
MSGGFECFRHKDLEPKNKPQPLTKLHYRLDMRSRMRDTTKSYVSGFELNQPLSGGGVSEVIESKNDAYPVGTIVTGFVGWEQYTIVRGAQGLRAIPNARDSKIPLSSYVGVLGMPVRFWNRKKKNVLLAC